MQTNNITEKNRSIAEFIDYPKCDRCNDCGMYKFGAGIYFTPKDMEFHKSWDWLMPVVERIESMGYIVDISTNTITIIDDETGDEVVLQECISQEKLSAVYEAVCEFIEKEGNTVHVT